MFLHQSNKLEILFDQLRAILAQPLTDPFTPEIIVVHNQGMAVWIARQLAFANGIAANLHFPLPARFIWELFYSMTGSSPVEDFFRKPVLHWRIFTLLPQYFGHPDFQEISSYLRDDPAGCKRHQLAGRISDVFDQYLIYRPDLLSRWQANADETDWQACLWRELTVNLTPVQTRLTSAFHQGQVNGSTQAVTLPERLHLFGINSLAPMYLDIIEQVSRLTEVHLFHLSPCRHYWGDLLSLRQVARHRQKRKGPSVGSVDYAVDPGNPLLVSLGKTGQDFFRQLLEYDLQDIDLYRENQQQHLLAVLQNDMLDLRDRSTEPEDRFHLTPLDRSLQFHICCSPLREIQVLHDRLLDLFQDIPDLYPGDILVTAPDIQRYAAAVAGVFGEARPSLRIPYSLADLSTTEEQPVVRTFLELLNLLTGRFTASEVLALCESEMLLRRFDLEPASLPRLHAWVKDSGIRWGLDERHRQLLGVNTTRQHSWRFGLDRMLLGYLTGETGQSFMEIAPHGRIGSGEIEELGGFLTLMETLGQWRERLGTRRTVDDWHRHLIGMLADFFHPDGEEQGYGQLRETINGLRTDCLLAGMQEEIGFEVIRQHLETALTQPGGGQAFLSGRVTFCNMVPMRSVPFRVICLLGMNDLDFPRSQHPLAFDHLGQQPRLGDRNRRNDDRYLFLEALLSARDVLSISWVGRNQRDDSISLPSVVVSELQEYINQSCHAECGGACEQLTTRHPMQPFSRRCFDGTPATASYNDLWLPAGGPEGPSPFFTASLKEPGQDWRSVDIGQLARFWRHPVRFFVQEVLAMHLHREDEPLEESEPFALNALQQYQLRQEIIGAMQREHRPAGALYDHLSNSGRLPQQGFGQVLFDSLAATGQIFADQLAVLCALPLPPVEVDLAIGPYRLTGWLTDLFANGRITWRSALIKGETLMDLWLHHLLLNAAAPQGVPRCSIHVARNSAQGGEPALMLHTLRPVIAPENYLHQLLDLYWQGLSAPLHFYPQTSQAYAAADPEAAMQQARRAWEGGYGKPGEGDDGSYGYFFTQTDPFDQEFVRLSTLFLPIFHHLEPGCADA